MPSFVGDSALGKTLEIREGKESDAPGYELPEYWI